MRIKTVCIAPIVLLVMVPPFTCAALQMSGDNKQGEIPVRTIDITSVAAVPLLGGLPGISTSTGCAADGTIFIRLPTATGLSDLMSISRDGKTVTTFASNKIVDVSNPKEGAFFVGDDSILILVTGEEDSRATKLKFRKPNGEQGEITQQVGRLQKYIARFEHSGIYRGVTKLELPFDMVKIAAFPTGDFLAFGRDSQLNQPRLALVKWTGQFSRYLDLPEDDNSDADVKEKTEEPSGRFGLNNSLWSVGTAQMVPFRGNILLITQEFVHEISSSGNFRSVRLKTPQGYSLSVLKTGTSSWVGLFKRRRADGNGLEFATYSFDSQTGERLEKFTFTEPIGMGLACVSDEDFTFLKQNEKHDLLILRGTRAAIQAQDAPAPHP